MSYFEYVCTRVLKERNIEISGPDDEKHEIFTEESVPEDGYAGSLVSLVARLNDLYDLDMTYDVRGHIVGKDSYLRYHRLETVHGERLKPEEYALWETLGFTAYRAYYTFEIEKRSSSPVSVDAFHGCGIKMLGE